MFFFTYYYTYSLLSFSFNSVKLTPFFVVHAPLAVHSLLMLILSLLAVSFGVFFLSHVYPFLLFSAVPDSLKFFPILINFTFFIILFLLVRLLSLKNIFINRYFSQMMFLTPFILTAISKLYTLASFNFNKSFESGVLNYTFNIFPSLLLLSSGNLLFRQSMINPLQLVLFSLGLVFVFLS